MTRVRLSVAERREELVRAAMEQIEARGVAVVRIADVATALGVSNALVLYHFATKEKLVAEAFRYATEDDLAHLRELLSRRTTALRRLRAAIRWYAPTGQAKGWRLCPTPTPRTGPTRPWPANWACPAKPDSHNSLSRGRHHNGGPAAQQRTGAVPVRHARRVERPREPQPIKPRAVGHQATGGHTGMTPTPNAPHAPRPNRRRFRPPTRSAS
ncbi:TetR/AcrR family transcriptional regulator [Streptomyces tailanensis]|uniref:TetR/AcrR family transcriptional regulator n=1 Tax=Streptomyces tailanensis TaxID=2569858 RepID=UPI001FE769F5|nr:TetR/AcrR family transcriptional regulator [Streptomyces tailanensis]